MKNLKEKLRKNGGFTLVEMLIVVAIIAILIAVSIPMIGSALESSRHAVDQANERDAISLGSVAYLTGVINETEKLTWADGETSKNLYYVVDSTSHQGKLTATAPGEKAMCQCNDTEFHNGATLGITIEKATGKVTPNWEKAGG